MFSYAICSTQRSGSTMFCKYLEETQAFGVPRERLLFLERSENSLSGRPLELKKMSFSRGVKEAFLDSESNATGVKGIKIMASTLRRFPKSPPNGEEHFLKQAHASFRDIASVTKYIYWKRRDKLGQALSHYYMRKTGIAHTYNESDAKKYRESIEELKVEVEGVEEELIRLKKDEHYWDKFFIVNEIDPLVIYYEDFLLDKKKWLNVVADFIGIDGFYLKSCFWDKEVGIKKISDRSKEDVKSRVKHLLEKKYPNSYNDLFSW